MLLFKRYKMFLLSVLMYAVLGAATSLLSAVSQMTDEQFAEVITKSLTSRHAWILLLTTVTAAITQIRALMNKDYHEAGKV